MLHIKSFVCNPYQENTYLLYDEEGHCAIVDPGMYGEKDQAAVAGFIESEGLKPLILLNTHCHIDHVLGNRFVYEQYGLLPLFHEKELALLVEVENYAPQMGIHYDLSPIGEQFLPEKGEISLGKHLLEIIFAPGHSPGHLCFYHADQGILIGGDVLFYNSIGRTDLPGGDHAQLLDSIRTRIFSLPGETIVYPGHGPETTVDFEKRTNPFLR